MGASFTGRPPSASRDDVVRSSENRSIDRARANVPMYVTSREDCGGGRCARSSESLVRGDVVARDSFIDFERVHTGVESWSCVSCGRFLGRIDDALGASARAIASELVETNEQTRDLPTLARVRGRDGDALALCEDSKRCAWRGRGDGGVGATFEGGRE